MKLIVKPVLSFAVIGMLGLSSAVQASVSDFEDVALPSDGFRNAANGVSATGVTSGGVTFPWKMDSSGFFPVEFAVSNLSDTTDYLNDGDPLSQRYDHPYNSITGGGSGPSEQYAVANALEAVEVPLPADPISVDITNTTYAFYSMQNGDGVGGFAKKFGGPTGNDADYFSLTITGKNGVATVGVVEFFLADFRNINGAPDEIVGNWRTVDLSGLAGSDRLVFSMTSSDIGSFGMNTPAYFAMDNLLLTPEPSAAVLLAFGALGWLRNRKRSGARFGG